MEIVCLKNVSSFLDLIELNEQLENFWEILLLGAATRYCATVIREATGVAGGYWATGAGSRDTLRAVGCNSY